MWYFSSNSFPKTKKKQQIFYHLMKTFPEGEAVGNHPASLSVSEVTQVKSTIVTARAAVQH